MGMSVSFFFNDTATTEIYTLSLHDALPICDGHVRPHVEDPGGRHQPAEARRPGVDRRLDEQPERALEAGDRLDRKSTRLNSSHANISYAVFCLKKKKIRHRRPPAVTDTRAR